MAEFLDLLIADAAPVMIVTNDFPPRRGGIQTYVRGLCDLLPPQRVVVYAPASEGGAEHDADLPFVVIRDVASVLLPTPALVRRVKATIAQYGVGQVVYGASVPLGLMARSVHKAGVKRQIALTHGHEVWWAALPGTRQLLRRVIQDVDVATYVSRYTHARISRALRQEDAAGMVHLRPRIGSEFHPAVDGTEVRAALHIPSHAPVAICVARLVRRKGQDRLIRIWPRVLEELPDARLLVVGDGPDRRRLQRMVARKALADRVLIVGQVPDASRYYAAADVFSMPVRNRLLGLEVEGLGISYLEAEACGLRVIAGRSGGAPEAYGISNPPFGEGSAFLRRDLPTWLAGLMAD
jgi:phosphatidyl-myo-inositol dimannoside synthase